MKMCCHHWGNCGKTSKQRQRLWYLSDSQFSPSTPSNQKKKQLTNAEKTQILQYFLENDIAKISLKNNKLVILYNNKNTQRVEAEDPQQQKIHRLVQNLSNQSLSLNELQENSRTTSDNSGKDNSGKNNIGTYIGLTVAAFLLGGAFIYFLTRKKKK